MSQFERSTCNCPKCKSEIGFTRWTSINADLNPEIREELFTGNFGKVICPRCGQVSYVEYDFLYHDMRGKYMIGVSSDFSDAAKQLGVPKDYILRKVYGINALIEKIKIFDDGYNDIALEIMKEVIKNLQRINKREEMLYAYTKGKRIGFALSKSSRIVELDSKFYNTIIRDLDMSEFEEEYGKFLEIGSKSIKNLFKRDKALRV